MTGAEHLAKAEQYAAELEKGELESFAGSKQVTALMSLTHAAIAIADGLGIPHDQGAPAQAAAQ